MTQIFVKTGLKKSRKLQFWRICEPPLLSSLFSESHLTAWGDNHPNTVARQYGKRELKEEEGVAFLQKSQISDLIGKIRLKTCFGLVFQARPFSKGMQNFG